MTRSVSFGALFILAMRYFFEFFCVIQSLLLAARQRKGMFGGMEEWLVERGRNLFVLWFRPVSMSCVNGSGPPSWCRHGFSFVL